MGKHDRPSPSDPVPALGNVTADTWTKIITAAVCSDKGEQWTKNAVRNAENARNN